MTLNRRGPASLRSSRAGFTLIELLVVIAIIGILSAVVLASLSTARSKGNDAAVQSNLSTIQTQAEIYYGNNSNSYGNVSTAGSCTSTTGMFSDTTIKAAITSAIAAGRTGTSYCSSNGSAYVAEVPVNATSSAAYWCVDSTGIAKYEYAAMTAQNCI